MTGKIAWKSEAEIAAQIRADLAEVEAFRAWLDSHGERRIVGQTCHSGACPLARYLSRHGEAIEVYGEPSIAVWGAQLRPNDRTVPLPAWATAFVSSLDKTFPDREVSREEALRALGQE